MIKYIQPLLICSVIWADGGMMPPQGDYEIYSSDQVAVIKKTTYGEELSILVKAQWTYSYDYKGFAWIIPLPSLPQIQEANVDIFTDLAYLSAPVYGGSGCSGIACAGDDRSEGSLGGDYHYVVSYDTIGFLEAVVIHTNAADSLTNWLTTHEYTIVPGAPGMFNDYISHDWNYFFCARVDTSVIADSYKNVGVRLIFNTYNLVYPMKISSLSSTHNVGVYLYVIDQHKMFCNGAELEYANMISEQEMNEISHNYPALSEYITEGAYITKLKLEYNDPSDMSSDIYIYQSPDDTEYQKFYTGYYGSVGYANNILAPFIMYLIFLGIKRITKRKHSR